MQTSQSRKRDILTKMEETRMISTEGKEWLVTALDPFHDYEHPLAGYPDADGSQTIISCFTYQANIAAPTGVAGNWDLHLFTTPLATARYVDFGSLDVSGTSAQIPVDPYTSLMGPLTIVSGAAGANLADPAGATYTSQALPLEGNSDILDGSSRVIAMAYEVVNTTAKLYQQGTITSYRMPQYGTDAMWGVEVLGTDLQMRSGKRFLAAPPEVAAAMLLKGTRTWDAGEGVYSVCALGTTVNPIQLASPQYAQFVAADVFDTPVVTPLFESTPKKVVIDTSLASVSYNVPAVDKFNHFDTSGSFFTGLSNATSLTVTLRVVVERAPTFLQPALAVLASPSAGYDLRALEMYAMAVTQLPVAVKFGENAKGDWWRSVLRTIGDAADMIGSFVPLPWAGTIGKGVRLLTGALAEHGSSNEFAAQKMKAAPRAAPKQAAKPKPKPKPEQLEEGRRKARNKAK